MAFAIRITGVGLSPESAWTQDMVNWWPERQLIKDRRFRLIEEDRGYLDYVAVLSRSEALALHNRFFKRAYEHEQQALAELGVQLLQQAPNLCWVVVNIYEWESGL